MKWTIVPSPVIVTIVVPDEPECKHIISSGTEGLYIVIDDGPFFTGEVEFLTKKQVERTFQIQLP